MSLNNPFRVIVLSLLLIVAVVVLIPRLPQSRPPRAEVAAVVQVQRVEDLSKEVAGAVVYQGAQGIYQVDLASPTPKLIAKRGRYPRWSPDGKHIAFIAGNKIVRIRRGGGKLETLATLRKEPTAIAYHANGREVYFSDGDRVQAVSIQSHVVRTLLTGYEVRELDLARNGERLVATIKGLGFHVRAFDLAQGKQWKVANGCSASLSPEGNLVTNNGPDHKQLFLRDWFTGEVVESVDAPPGHTFDNQTWSNDEDWLVSINDDGPQKNVYIHQLSKNRVTQVATAGDSDRPDLYIDQLLDAGKESEQASDPAEG